MLILGGVLRPDYSDKSGRGREEGPDRRNNMMREGMNASETDKKALSDQGLFVDQNGRAGTFQCNYHCVCEFVECKPSNHRFYPPCYLTHMLLNRIKPIINAVRVNI